MSYTHGSTNNEIFNGSEVPREPAGKRLPFKRGERLSQRRKRARDPEHDLGLFHNCFTGCWTACAAADYYQLPGGPFMNASSAREALRREAINATGMSAMDALRYSTWDLASMLQFDLRHGDGPLPPEGLLGLERHVALTNIFADSIANLSNVSNFELLSAVAHTKCCRTTLAEQMKEYEEEQKRKRALNTPPPSPPESVAMRAKRTVIERRRLAICLLYTSPSPRD